MSSRLDSEVWICRGHGGTMIGRRPSDDLCPGCINLAMTTEPATVEDGTWPEKTGQAGRGAGMSKAWDKTLWQTHLLSSGLGEGTITTGLAYSTKADQFGNVVVTLPKLAEISKCSLSTVYSRTVKLVAAGYVARVGRRSGRYGGPVRKYLLMIPGEES